MISDVDGSPYTVIVTDVEMIRFEVSHEFSSWLKLLGSW
jgi:hypothetical protein